MTMNLCFSTLGCTERSLDEIFDLCACFGFKMLEIRGIGGVLDNRLIPDFSAKKIDTTVKKFKSAGVTPLILGTSCSFHEKDNFENALSEGRAAILTAAALGASGIRVFGNNLGKNPAESTERVIDGISTLCQTADENGVDILLEVHGDFNTVETLMPVVSALKNEKHFGLIWDICHTQKTYGENWREFYDAFKEHIRHVHIKDVRGDELVLTGDGEIPIKNIVSHMICDGYSGAFSLEWEKKWHPELAEIEEALVSFKEIMMI